MPVSTDAIKMEKIEITEYEFENWSQSTIDRIFPLACKKFSTPLYYLNPTQSSSI